MLVVQIALGIVLGVVILRFWKEILSLGILGVLLIIVGAAIIFGGNYIYHNYEKLTPFFIGIIVFIGIAFVLGVLGAVAESTNERLTAITLKKWRLTFGEIVLISFTSCLFISGLSLIIWPIITNEFKEIQIPVGSTILLITIIIWFAEIRKKLVYRNQRGKNINNIEANKT